MSEYLEVAISTDCFTPWKFACHDEVADRVFTPMTLPHVQAERNHSGVKVETLHGDVDC